MTRRSVFSDDEIVARARAVFVEHGYAARTRQIAAAVGLTWGAITVRFGGKRALFFRAMGMPPDGGSPLERDAAASQDLPQLLARLRACLGERWPLHLQLRLATTRPEPVPDELMAGLAAALQTHQRRGALRSDLSAGALAQLVMALIVGDVARGFVARESAGPPDPAFLDGVLRLVSAT